MEQDQSASVEGLRIIVTGAARGIGLSTVRELCSSGAEVVAVDVDADELAIADLPDRATALAADLRDIDGIPGLITRASDALGGVDGLVNVAGVIRRRDDVDDVTEQDWDLQHDVNLKAPFFLCRAFRDQVRRQGSAGSIVLFSSQGWWSGGFGGSVVYAASKGGVVSLTRGLARTFAPDRIRVNCIAPGLIDTRMMSDGLDDAARAGLLSTIPLGRLGDPEEVAKAATYLVSRSASYITGATLNVSGGQLMY